MGVVDPDIPSARALCDIDYERILAPLPKGGKDVRYSGPHDTIREALRDEPSLPQGAWQKDRKVADCAKAISLCHDVLANQSKDLLVAAWLTEALLRRDGFTGLAAGLDIMLCLCQSFWASLFPLVETVSGQDGEDGLPDFEARLSPFTWMNTKFPPLVLTQPITGSGAFAVESYSWADLKRAEKAEAINEKAAKRGEAPGAITLAAVMASADATPHEFLAEQLSGLDGALATIDGLNAFLTEQCGRQRPSLGALSEALSEIRSWLEKRMPADSLPAPATDRDDDLDPVADAVTRRISVPSLDSPIDSREDAYRRLRQIADYLMRTEPHSPTPYVLKRVSGWSRLSLDQLLREISGDRGDLAAILDLIKDTH